MFPPSEEFSCRTKIITGITYKVFLFDSEDQVVLPTSFYDEERAKKYIAYIIERDNIVRGEIIQHSWTKEVCIECGEESTW